MPAGRGSCVFKFQERERESPAPFLPSPAHVCCVQCAQRSGVLARLIGLEWTDSETFFLPPCSGCPPEMIARYLMQRARSSRVPPGSFRFLHRFALGRVCPPPLRTWTEECSLGVGRQGAHGLSLIGLSMLCMLGEGALGHVFVVRRRRLADRQRSIHTRGRT